MVLELPENTFCPRCNTDIINAEIEAATREVEAAEIRIAAHALVDLSRADAELGADRAEQQMREQH